MGNTERSFETNDSSGERAIENIEGNSKRSLSLLENSIINKKVGEIMEIKLYFSARASPGESAIRL